MIAAPRHVTIATTSPIWTRTTDQNVAPDGPTALPQRLVVERPLNGTGIEVTLLGAFGLVGDVCTRGAAETAQRLLALLALWDQPLSRGFTAGTLWLDASDQQAGASLRSTLWRLREARPDLVVARPGHALRGPHGAAPQRVTFRL